MVERVQALSPAIFGLRIVDKPDLFPVGYDEDRLVAILTEDLCATQHDFEMLTEAAGFDEVDEYYNPGADEVPYDYILEAIVVEKFSKTEHRMAALLRVLKRHFDNDDLQPLPAIVGKPRKTGSFAYVTVQLPFTDGQTVSIIFHSPEGDKKKITPSDTIIAFRWLLNRRDITHVVAPEDGSEISLQSVCKRIAQLVKKNSARFQRTQKEAQAERKELEKLRDDVRDANERQRDLMDQIADGHKEAQTIGARLSNTLALLEKQKAINAELQARLDALRKGNAGRGGAAGNSTGTGAEAGADGGGDTRPQDKGTGNTTPGEPVVLDVPLELPITAWRPEAMRVAHVQVNGRDWYLVQTQKNGEWITQKEHPTAQSAMDDAKGWYPEPQAPTGVDATRNALVEKLPANLRDRAQHWSISHIESVLTDPTGLHEHGSMGSSHIYTWHDKIFMEDKELSWPEIERIVHAHMKEVASKEHAMVYLHPLLSAVKEVYGKDLEDLGYSEFPHTGNEVTVDEDELEATASSSTPGFVETLNDILAGKHDANTDTVDKLLDEAATKAEAAGRFDEFSSLFDQAADHLTELLKKKQGGM